MLFLYKVQPLPQRYCLFHRPTAVMVEQILENRVWRYGRIRDALCLTSDESMLLDIGNFGTAGTAGALICVEVLT